MSSESIDVNDSCRVCYEDAKIMGISTCNHPICSECVLKMKYLMNQLNCPICRDPLKYVIFDNSPIKKYNEYDKNCLVAFNHDDFYCVSEEIKKTLEKVISYKCSNCDEVLTSEYQLREHILQVHQKYFCDLCMGNLHFFPKDYKLYTHHELIAHTWDKNNGHPLCSLCDTRYFNDDQLILHLRREHICCYICEKNGKNVYFLTPEKLREHAEKQHFICSIDSCSFIDSISIFETEEEFRDHKILYHFKELTPADYNKIQPFSGNRNRNTNRRGGHHEAIQPYVVTPSIPVTTNDNLSIDDLEAFPSLTGKKEDIKTIPIIESTKKISKNNKANEVRKKTYEDNFPLLAEIPSPKVDTAVEWGSKKQVHNQSNTKPPPIISNRQNSSCSHPIKMKDDSAQSKYAEINTKSPDEFPPIVTEIIFQKKQNRKNEKPPPSHGHIYNKKEVKAQGSKSKLLQLVEEACAKDDKKYKKFIELSGRYYRREITANSYRNRGIEILGRSQVMDNLIPHLAESLDEDLKNSLLDLKKKKNKEDIKLI